MIARRARRLKDAQHRRKAADALLIKQAGIPDAQAGRRNYEVVELAEDPGGDVIVRGEMIRHRAVRTQPAWREMLARNMFARVELDLGGKKVAVPEKQIAVALEWYQERLDAAESYSVKSGLDFSSPGGAAASHIPTHEAAMMAQSDVAWARGVVAPACLPVFDAVMRDGVSLRETARRMSGARHLADTPNGRLSIERMRKRISGQFVQAAGTLAREHHQKMVPQSGRIVAQPGEFSRLYPEEAAG